MKKAQAGLPIVISVVVSIFLIGLLVFIYALMNNSLADTDSLYISQSGTVVNETLTTVESSFGENTSVSAYRSSVCTLIDISNASNGVTIDSSNYTQTNCHFLSTATAVGFNNTDWNVSYSYTYLAQSGATDVINDTTISLAGVTSWFSIMIVITAMIVLILLTVIIITAIRSSGLMEGKGGNKKGGNIGTA